MRRDCQNIHTHPTFIPPDRRRQRYRNLLGCLYGNFEQEVTGQTSRNMVNGEGRFDAGRVGQKPTGRSRSNVASTSAAIAGNEMPAGDEFRDRDLVGGIEHCRRRPARLHGLARQRQRGKPDGIGRLEGQFAHLRQIEPRRRAVDPLPARPGNGRSVSACRAGRVAPPPSRRGTRPGHARPIADAPARRSPPAAARTDDAPRSAPGPCSSCVAESIVIFGPIDQLGWRSACSGVAALIASSVQVRNGPPDAVRIMRRTSSRRPEPSAWNIALCSQSTGSTVAPACAGAAHEQSAGADQTFLVGERDRGAAFDRRHGRLQADRAARSPPSPSRPDAPRPRSRRLSPAAASMPLPAKRIFQFAIGVRVGNHGKRGADIARDLRQRRGIAVRGDRLDVVAPRFALDQIDGAGARPSRWHREW